MLDCWCAAALFLEDDDDSILLATASCNSFSSRTSNSRCSFALLCCWRNSCASFTLDSSLLNNSLAIIRRFFNTASFFCCLIVKRRLRRYTNKIATKISSAIDVIIPKTTIGSLFWVELLIVSLSVLPKESLLVCPDTPDAETATSKRVSYSSSVSTTAVEIPTNCNDSIGTPTISAMLWVKAAVPCSENNTDVFIFVTICCWLSWFSSKETNILYSIFIPLFSLLLSKNLNLLTRTLVINIILTRLLSILKVSAMTDSIANLRSGISSTDASIPCNEITWTNRWHGHAKHCIDAM